MAFGKKTGGRKAGTPNKRTAELVDAARASGRTPLEYMLGVQNDPAASPERRDAMARAAAPYVHPRMSAPEPNAGGNIHVSIIKNFGDGTREVVDVTPPKLIEGSDRWR